MDTVINVVIQAGHSALDIALYTLLPVMVVMMALMRLLENKGVIDMLVRWVSPVVRPFGLSGLGLLAAVQTSFVSFIAPLPTLALMNERGEPDRRIAAALAAVFAMAPANATFPLVAFGLNAGHALLVSMTGGIIAAALTYWVFGRSLSDTALPPTRLETEIRESQSIMRVIGSSGAEAIQMVLNIIPMLIVALAAVFALQQAGAVAWLVAALAPLLAKLGINAAHVLPSVTKYLAGGTALVGLYADMHKQGQLSPNLMNGSAGFLLHPVDPTGVAILISAGVRVARVCRPALAGGLAGILVRSVL